MTTEATKDAPTDADHRIAVAGQVERVVMPLVNEAKELAWDN